ncbi:ribosome biogenesis GTPase YlqF [Dysosmobacter sp.]|uniref:ribosome biogenesis GTPase YlqF n=1 Tax=Dysosmobacter sp. TaxID=2591382 RepID=UPI002A87DD30|nr:ribosome biogenesis GTPase YlqF [Dysosmobacter sp.]MDY3282876.1 ribosome biogenesis GTPase YlqF [Dysosmobacter sp.]
MNIQWYPGHMTKTRRMIAEQIKNMDAVCEILDSRIPLSSRNPDVDELTAGKPRLVVLNRVDQADPAATKQWAAYFRSKGYAVLESNAKSGVGTKQFAAAVRELLADKLRAYAEKGQVGRVVRVMILGIPNVGKSTFINQVARRKTAQTGDRPGVTRSKQWVPVDAQLELLDTPGILWPKFEDQSVGLNLAFTGAVKDEILDTETLGCHLMAYLGERYPESLKTAYKLPALPERQPEEDEVAYGYRLLEAAGRKRGFLISGGEIDTERMANILLDEFRAGKLGRFTLELPETAE